MASDIKGIRNTAVQGVEGMHGRTDCSMSRDTAAADGSPTQIVPLNDVVARVQRLTDALRDLPDMDRARVNALHRAIQCGEYAIDDRAVADKLTAFEHLRARDRDG